MKRLILVLCFLFLAVPLAQARMACINGAKVNLRSGPGENFGVLWELGSGYPLQVLQTKGQWVKVSDFEQDKGWVYKKLLASTAHFIVKKPKINMRRGPGRKYPIVGQAMYGVVFKTLEKRKDWVKVRHENGLTGWVSRSLVWGW